MIFDFKLLTIVLFCFAWAAYTDSVEVHEAGSDVMCSDRDYDFTYPDVDLFDSFNNDLDVCERVFYVSENDEGTEYDYTLCCTPSDRAAMIEGCAPFESEYEEEGTYPFLCSDDTDATCDGVDSSEVGTWLLTYTAMDYSENIAKEEKVTVTYEDTTSPVIALETCDSYIFEDEKCEDFQTVSVAAEDCVEGYVNVDESITYLTLSETGKVEKGTDKGTKSPKTEVYCDGGEVVDEVDASTPGYYCVTYTASDSSGNEAETETIVYHIEDNTPPEIHFETESFTEECASLTSLPDPEAYATDEPCDNDLEATCDWTAAEISEALNTVGDYEIQYEASDGYNTATKSYSLTIEDTTAPSLTCPNDVELEVESTFTFEWATATDECDGDVTLTQSGKADVDADEVGTYTITFTAEDESGNSATCDQTIVIVDTTDPILNLKGDEYLTVEACTGTYVEHGATVTDNYDDDVSITISYSSTIDEDEVGDYTVTYSACDMYDNCATDIYRYVTVEDTVAPTIVLYGDELVMKEAGGYQKNSGAYATDDCSPEHMYPCVYCEEDDSECNDYCVSFTAEVVPYADFTKSEIESNYWESVYGDDADEVIYWCGESYDYGLEVRDEAVDAQNLTYLGQSCGEYIITYHVVDSHGNSATDTQYIWTVDTDSPEITISSLSVSSSSSSFLTHLVGGLALVGVGMMVMFGIMRNKRQHYSPIPM